MTATILVPHLEARVRPHLDKGNRRTKLLAFAELTIAGSFVIKGIRILQRDEPGNDEQFVVFPAEKGKGASADRWYDVAHPCTIEARATATAVILDAYKKAQEATA
jgi:DNA-binding cell septation regulator SpoVG